MEMLRFCSVLYSEMQTRMDFTHQELDMYNRVGKLPTVLESLHVIPWGQIPTALESVQQCWNLSNCAQEGWERFQEGWKCFLVHLEIIHKSPSGHRTRRPPETSNSIGNAYNHAGIVPT